MNKGVVILREWYDTISTLDPQDQADILAMMFAEDDSEVVASPVAMAVFSMMRPALIRQREKYEQVSEKRREVAQKRWKSEKYLTDNQQDMQLHAKECKMMQKDANAVTCIQDKNKDKNKNKNIISINIDNKKENILKEKGSFIPPTTEEVARYIADNGYNVDAATFVLYYESNGWMVGRTKMKSWRAAVGVWSRKNYTNKAKYNNGNEINERNESNRRWIAEQFAEAERVAQRKGAGVVPVGSEGE